MTTAQREEKKARLIAALRCGQPGDTAAHGDLSSCPRRDQRSRRQSWRRMKLPAGYSNSHSSTNVNPSARQSLFDGGLSTEGKAWFHVEQETQGWGRNVRG